MESVLKVFFNTKVESRCKDEPPSFPFQIKHFRINVQVQRKRGLPNTVQIICKYCAHTVPRNWPQSFTKGPKREGIVHQIFGQNLNLKGSCFRQMAARGLANMLALQICQLNQQIIHGLHKTNGWTYDSNEQRQLTLKWGEKETESNEKRNI